VERRAFLVEWRRLSWGWEVVSELELSATCR
jgi:hypothetical protein